MYVCVCVCVRTRYLTAAAGRLVAQTRGCGPDFARSKLDQT